KGDLRRRQFSSLFVVFLRFAFLLFLLLLARRGGSTRDGWHRRRLGRQRGRGAQIGSRERRQIGRGRRVRHWHSPVEAEVAVAAEPGIANPLRMPDQSAIERKLPVPAAWVSFGVVGVRRRYHVWRTADDGRVVRGLVADRPAISAPIVVEI